MTLIRTRKWLVGLFLAIMGYSTMGCGVSEASWNDYSYFDTVKMGGAWSGHEADTYLGTNILTYTGEKCDGKLKLIEPSWNIGLLGYENIEFYKGVGVRPITDLSINVIETGKMFPGVNFLADLIPAWTYVGAGFSLERNEEEKWKVRGKIVACVKVDIK